MDFDPKTLELFIPKDQTLKQAIVADIRLARRVRFHAKQYKQVFPHWSNKHCRLQGKKLAYALEVVRLVSETDQLVKDLNSESNS